MYWPGLPSILSPVLLFFPMILCDLPSWTVVLPMSPSSSSLLSWRGWYGRWKRTSGANFVLHVYYLFRAPSGLLCPYSFPLPLRSPLKAQIQEAMNYFVIKQQGFVFLFPSSTNAKLNGPLFSVIMAHMHWAGDVTPAPNLHCRQEHPLGAQVSPIFLFYIITWFLQTLDLLSARCFCRQCNRHWLYLYLMQKKNMFMIHNKHRNTTQ